MVSLHILAFYPFRKYEISLFFMLKDLIYKLFSVFLVLNRIMLNTTFSFQICSIVWALLLKYFNWKKESYHGKHVFFILWGKGIGVGNRYTLFFFQEDKNFYLSLD